MNSWLLFLLMTLFCIFTEAFFSMFEMASVSFNRLRLQFYETKKVRRAIWLKQLLDKPSRLFGTTLIAINTVLQLGSEASRRFYESVGLSPDIAPLSQIFLVLIFAELAPLFAARRYSEHVALISIPIIYPLSKIFAPFIWLIDILIGGIQRIFKGDTLATFYLTREEVQKVFEEKNLRDEMSSVVNAIFALKDMTAKQLMSSLEAFLLIPSTLSVKEVRQLFRDHYAPFILLYHQFKKNVVSVAYPHDLIRAKNEDLVSTYSHSIWFIAERLSIFQILNQFRHNNQNLSIVLDSEGQAIGILTLDQIINAIFAKKVKGTETISPFKPTTIIEKTFSGDMSLEEFNSRFHANLAYEGATTLSDLVVSLLKHHPSEGEMIYVDSFEITVKEVSLLGAKTVMIRTVF